MEKQFLCDYQQPVVKTREGLLRGFMFDDVYHFYGIRYAKARRFEAPLPITPWEGIRDAQSYGYICPVLDNPKPSGELKIPHRFWPESEHCQYLNIWTGSVAPGEKRPVMVWLHGGGFAAGSSIEQTAYDGLAMAKEKGVVLVSLNHRLNVFGYLDMSSFGPEYANSVNAGMADIVAALEWIQANIGAFGGDPDNVTVFGQSGGGMKVTVLGQIPAAAGLYHKGIVMSGVIGGFMDAPQVGGRELALAIMDELKIEDHDPKRLAKAPTALLQMAVNAAVDKFAAEGRRVNWGPQANDWYLGDPLTVPFGAYARKVPTIVGTVLGEFSFGSPLSGRLEMSDAQKEAAIAAKYGKAAAPKLMELFRKAYPGKEVTDVLYLDTIFRPASLEYVRKKAQESEAPTYCYQFTLDFDIDGATPAWHCSDIAFFMANTHLLPVCQIPGVTEKLEQQMTDSFVSFAKTGIPAADNLPQWTACTESSTPVMIFDRECCLRTDFEDELLASVSKSTPPRIFGARPKEVGEGEGFEEGGNAWVY